MTIGRAFVRTRGRFPPGEGKAGTARAAPAHPSFGSDGVGRLVLNLRSGIGLYRLRLGLRGA